jgi:hypothetical protein
MGGFWNNEPLKDSDFYYAAKRDGKIYAENLVVTP